jgi:hypothetical protein
MKNQLEVTRKLFGIFTQTVEKISESELELLLAGNGYLQFVVENSNHRLKEKKGVTKLQGNSDISEEALQKHLSELQKSKTRQEALNLLQANFRTKKNLIQITKLLKVYVNRNDKRDTIENKFVECVVGARLRSEAIQGLNLT